MSRYLTDERKIIITVITFVFLMAIGIPLFNRWVGN